MPRKLLRMTSAPRRRARTSALLSRRSPRDLVAGSRRGAPRILHGFTSSERRQDVFAAGRCSPEGQSGPMRTRPGGWAGAGYAGSVPGRSVPRKRRTQSASAGGEAEGGADGAVCRSRGSLRRRPAAADGRRGPAAPTERRDGHVCGAQRRARGHGAVPREHNAIMFQRTGAPERPNV
jgi:hypothetical protein